jgi:predicted DNA-binding transcriptional regulator AlpA
VRTSSAHTNGPSASTRVCATRHRQADLLSDRASGWDAPTTLLRCTDAAHRLGISRQQLYKLMARGLVPWIELPSVRGRRISNVVITAMINAGHRGGWATKGEARVTT